MTALLCVCLFVQKLQPLATLHDVVASVFGLVVGAATILATTTLYYSVGPDLVKVEVRKKDPLEMNPWRWFYPQGKCCTAVMCKR